MALPSVQDIYRYLNEDPERVPFTGDKRRQAITQLANQEARQQRNNKRALDLLIDKAAPNQKTTPERSAKESGKPVEAKRKGRFDLDIIQEFDVNDLQWGQPSKNQGKKMQRPIKTMDLDVSDLALPPFSPNDSPETYQELLEIQEMGLLRDQRQKDISSQQTKEGILSEFKEYADAHSLLTNWDFVRMVMDDVQTIVLSLKFAFNRPRPDTLAQHLGIILSVDGDGTFHTPAYPSYHSTVSRLIAEVMAGAYVGHKTELLRIADKIGMNRVIAGYHYMSDHQAGLVLANQLVLKITTNLSINPVYEKEETIDSKTAEAVTENFMDTLEEVHRRGEAVKKEDEGEYEDSYMEAVRMAIGRHADETAFMTDVNKADTDDSDEESIFDSGMRERAEVLGFEYDHWAQRIYNQLNDPNTNPYNTEALINAEDEDNPYKDVYVPQRVMDAHKKVWEAAGNPPRVTRYSEEGEYRPPDTADMMTSNEERAGLVDELAEETSYRDADWDNKRHMFVFGSNLLGRNGKGAAEYAQNFGATGGGVRGADPDRVQGNTYSLPTKRRPTNLNTNPNDKMPLSEMKHHFENFARYVLENPKTVFHIPNLGMANGGHGGDEQSKKNLAATFSNAFKTVNPAITLDDLKGRLHFDKGVEKDGKVGTGLGDFAFEGKFKDTSATYIGNEDTEMGRAAFKAAKINNPPRLPRDRTAAMNSTLEPSYRDAKGNLKGEALGSPEQTGDLPTEPKNSDGNVYSRSNDPFLAALTHPTEKSLQNKKIKTSYPVIYKGIKYPDAEAAYTGLIRAATPEPSIEKKEEIMREVNLAKFAMYPRLADELEKRGGIEYLGTLKHDVKTATGDKAWEGEGADSLMLSSLAHAFAIHKGLKESDLGAFQRENPSVWKNLDKEKENVQTGAKRADAKPYTGPLYIRRNQQRRQSSSSNQGVEAGYIPHNFNYNKDNKAHWTDEPEYEDTPNAPSTELHRLLGNTYDAILAGVRTSTSRQAGPRRGQKEGQKNYEDLVVGDTLKIGPPTDKEDADLDREGWPWLTVRVVSKPVPVSEVDSHEQRFKEGWSNHSSNRYNHRNLSNQGFVRIEFELVKEDDNNRRAVSRFLRAWQENPEVQGTPLADLTTRADFQQAHEDLLPKKDDRRTDRDMILHSGMAKRGADNAFGYEASKLEDEEHQIKVIGHSFEGHGGFGAWVYPEGHSKEGVRVLDSDDDKRTLEDFGGGEGAPPKQKARARIELGRWNREHFEYDNAYGRSPHGYREEHSDDKLFDAQHRAALEVAKKWVDSHFPTQNWGNWWKWDQDDPDWVSKNRNSMALMTRNVEQVRSAEAVIAAVPRIHKDGAVLGASGRPSGTVAAVAMGINKGIPVYVYDESAGVEDGGHILGGWKEWDYAEGKWKETYAPPYYKEVAAIGSRDIKETDGSQPRWDSTGTRAIAAWVKGASEFQKGEEPFAPVKIWDTEKGAWDYTRSGPKKSILGGDASEEDKAQLQKEGEELDARITEDGIHQQTMDMSSFVNKRHRETEASEAGLDKPAEWMPLPPEDTRPDLSIGSSTRFKLAWQKDMPTGGDAKTLKRRQREFVLDNQPDMKNEMERLREFAKAPENYSISQLVTEHLVDEEWAAGLIKAISENREIKNLLSEIRPEEKQAYISDMVKQLVEERMRSFGTVLNDIIEYGSKPLSEGHLTSGDPLINALKDDIDQRIAYNQGRITDGEKRSEELIGEGKADKSRTRKRTSEAILDSLTQRWVNTLMSGDYELMEKLHYKAPWRAGRQLPLSPEFEVHEDYNPFDYGVRGGGEATAKAIRAYLEGRGEGNVEINAPLDFDNFFVASDDRTEDGETGELRQVTADTDSGGLPFMGREGGAKGHPDSLSEAGGVVPGTPEEREGTDPVEFDPTQVVTRVYEILQQLIPQGIHYNNIVTGEDLAGLWSGYGSDQIQPGMKKAPKDSLFLLSDVLYKFYGLTSNGDFDQNIGQAISPSADTGRLSLFNQLIDGYNDGELTNQFDLLEWSHQWGPNEAIKVPGTGEDDESVLRSLGTKDWRDQEAYNNQHEAEQKAETQAWRDGQNRRKQRRYATGEALHESLLKKLSEEHPDAYEKFMGLKPLEPINGEAVGRMITPEQQEQLKRLIFPHTLQEVADGDDENNQPFQRNQRFNFILHPLGQDYYTDPVFTRELLYKWAAAPKKFREFAVGQWQNTSNNAWAALSGMQQQLMRRQAGIEYKYAGGRPVMVMGKNQFPNHDLDYLYLSNFLKISDHSYINRKHPEYFPNGNKNPQGGEFVLPEESKDGSRGRKELLSYSHNGIGNLREDKHLGSNEKFSDFINSPNALNILLDDVEQAIEAFQQTGTGIPRYLDFKLIDSLKDQEAGERQINLDTTLCQVNGDPLKGVWDKSGAKTSHGFSTQSFLVGRLMALVNHRRKLYTDAESSGDTSLVDQWEDLTGVHYLAKTLEDGTEIEAAPYSQGRAGRNTEFMKQLFVRHMGGDGSNAYKLNGIPDVIKKIYQAFSDIKSKHNPYSNPKVNIKEAVRERLAEARRTGGIRMAGISAPSEYQTAKTKGMLPTGMPFAPEEETQTQPVYDESFDTTETGESLLAKVHALAKNFTSPTFQRVTGSGDRYSVAELKGKGWDSKGKKLLENPVLAARDEDQADLLAVMKQIMKYEKMIRAGNDERFGTDQMKATTYPEIRQNAEEAHDILGKFYGKVFSDARFQVGVIDEERGEGFRRAYDEYRNLPEGDTDALIAHLQKNKDHTIQALMAGFGSERLRAKDVNGKHLLTRLLEFSPYVQEDEKSQNLNEQLMALAQVYTPQMRGIMHKIQHGVLTSIQPTITTDARGNVLSRQFDNTDQIDWFNIPKEYRLLSADDSPTTAEQIEQYVNGWNALSSAQQESVANSLAAGGLTNPSEFFNPKNPNSIINWGDTNSREQAVKADTIAQNVATEVLRTVQGNESFEEEALEHLMKNPEFNLSPEAQEKLRTARSEDREVEIKETIEDYVYQATLSNNLWENRELFREGQQLENVQNYIAEQAQEYMRENPRPKKKTTKKEQLAGIKEATDEEITAWDEEFAKQMDIWRIENPNPTTTYYGDYEALEGEYTVDGPVFRPTNLDNPSDPRLAKFDADRDQIKLIGSGGLWASMWGLEHEQATVENIRKERELYKDTIVEADHHAPERNYARDMVNKMLDCLASGDLPDFTGSEVEDSIGRSKYTALKAIEGININPTPNKARKNSASARITDRKTEQMGSALKYIMSIMDDVGNIDGADEIWERIGVLNNVPTGGFPTVLASLAAKRTEVVRNIISNHPMGSTKTNPNYGAQQASLEKELLEYYSEQGHLSNGRHLHWTDSGRASFEDWATNHLDKKMETVSPPPQQKQAPTPALNEESLNARMQGTSSFRLETDKENNPIPDPQGQYRFTAEGGDQDA